MQRKTKFHDRKQLLILILLASLCACSSNQPPIKAPLAYQIKEQLDHDFLIIRDPELKSFLENLVSKLVTNYSNQISIDLVKDKYPFARSFPAGLVLVSSSLAISSESESELAFVIAHELGHVLLGHHSEASERINLDELKNRELAADAFGAKALIRAGYAINGAYSSIQRLTNSWGFYTEQGNSGYPTNIERLTNLQDQILDHDCIMQGSCLMGGIDNTREFVRFKRRLLDRLGNPS